MAETEISQSSDLPAGSESNRERLTRCERSTFTGELKRLAETTVGDIAVSCKRPKVERGDNGSANTSEIHALQSFTDDNAEVPPPSTGFGYPEEEDYNDGGPEVRRCENCGFDRPRTSYHRRQWAKPYGGWTCTFCVEEAIKQRRDAEKEEIRRDKAERHEHVMSDKVVKEAGIWKEGGPRRCFTCKEYKEQEDYSNKQWKTLYRECSSCIRTRKESGIERRKPIGLVAASNAPSLSSGSPMLRVCCTCRGEKTRDGFSKKQWRNPSNMLRMCSSCHQDEERRKAKHKAELEEEAARRKTDLSLPERRRCFSCGTFGESADFSSKQWGKNYGRCARCIETERAAKRAGGASDNKTNTDAENSEGGNAADGEVSKRMCGGCNINCPRDAFARAQWKRSSSDRRCRACAAKDVKERDEHIAAEANIRKEQDNVASGRDSESALTDEKKENRRCFRCKTFQTFEAFSTKQWKKTYRTCKECMGAGGHAFHAQ
uniref:Stc1 domain-containing protein n=1 Tax=Odontella aurita TaxID=265563 RepID=A0A7S4HUF8_9STRA|mmetsp:Transcript_15278/g.44363  ORF Transcript_15278/g.44363 Transcript_15278/m.44363 type:complete len:489 (+) Transcript_15278:114-1580(+)|eukprot:CAMPEP_0113556876 /NCGR_PEP_ID=MMETSP0015_2-20120614/17487_1 /TAXON_ID=2838 /ORGANISM="Odontella" /LENGTH=488 /DNA_ID=CAMNT_0000458255 /DNA_START=64 /DNA_END=1530 /DNA_ORIENTATION=- /assembly_acc=CAM_ASM_000160